MDAQREQEDLEELITAVDAELSSWKAMVFPISVAEIEQRLSEKKSRVDTLIANTSQMQENLTTVLSNPEPLKNALTAQVETLRQAMIAMESSQIPGLQFDAESVVSKFDGARDDIEGASDELMQMLSEELPEFLAETCERSQEQVTSLKEEMDNFGSRISKGTEDSLSALQQIFSSLEEQSEGDRDILRDLQSRVSGVLKAKFAEIGDELGAGITESVDRYEEFATNLRDVQGNTQEIMQAAQLAMQASGTGLSAGANALEIVKGAMEAVS